MISLFLIFFQVLIQILDKIHSLLKYSKLFKGYKYKWILIFNVILIILFWLIHTCFFQVYPFDPSMRWCFVDEWLAQSGSGGNGVVADVYPSDVEQGLLPKTATVFH